MLLALGLLALVGLWWLGRSGGRMPGGLRPRRLAGYAALLVAGLLAVRGSVPGALLLGGAGLVLLGDLGRTARGLGRGVGDFFARTFGPRTLGLTARSAFVRRTAAIAFDLDRDGRPTDGLILAGPREGRRLAEVPSPDLVALWRLCGTADPDGAGLLEAYLDRRHPRWRVDAQRDADTRPGGPSKPGAMTEEEAYQVLGLQRGASAEEIRAAHRGLMKRLHPDQGGTAERAARVNAARDRLTNRHR